MSAFLAMVGWLLIWDFALLFTLDKNKFADRAIDTWMDHFGTGGSSFIAIFLLYLFFMFGSTWAVFIIASTLLSL